MSFYLDDQIRLPQAISTPQVGDVAPEFESNIGFGGRPQGRWRVLARSHADLDQVLGPTAKIPV